MRLDTFKDVVRRAQCIYKNSYQEGRDGKAGKYTITYEGAAKRALLDYSAKTILSQEWITPIALLLSEAWDDIGEWSRRG